MSTCATATEKGASKSVRNRVPGPLLDRISAATQPELGYTAKLRAYRKVLAALPQRAFRLTADRWLRYFLSFISSRAVATTSLARTELLRRPCNPQSHLYGPTLQTFDEIASIMFLGIHRSEAEIIRRDLTYSASCGLRKGKVADLRCLR